MSVYVSVKCKALPAYSFGAQCGKLIFSLRWQMVGRMVLLWLSFQSFQHCSIRGTMQRGRAVEKERERESLS